MSDTNNDTSHYEGVLLEEMNSKIDAILEAHVALVDVPARLDRIDGRLEVVESDVRAIKAAVKDQSKDFKHLLTRVGKLEQASAR